MSTRQTAYDIAVVAHVVTAVLGFGSLGVSGFYAAMGPHAARPGVLEEIGRYFRRVNWAGRTVWAVPVLGALAVALSEGGYTLEQAWVLGAAGCWVVAITLASAVIWPAERRIRSMLLSAVDTPPSCRHRAAMPGDPAIAPSLLRELQVVCHQLSEDEGYEGATLVRPALERLRDLAAQVPADVVMCDSPDRLARRYAYQAQLIDEFTRAGTEVRFVKCPRGETPEDELLIQFQGMIAEHEQAQIAERTRRGKAHRARAGFANVLSGAPYGYRYVRRTDTSEARYEIVEDDAGGSRPPSATRRPVTQNDRSEAVPAAATRSAQER